MKMKECKLETAGRPASGQIIDPGFDEAAALAEARRCLGSNRCESCNLCQLLCPDLAIMRDEGSGELVIDYDLCKRCGICTLICPKGAIQMVPEI